MSAPSPVNSTWTAEKIADLRRLCEKTDLSLTEIAAAMGLSKNQVVGKARRLKVARSEIVLARYNGGGWKRRREKTRPMTIEPMPLGLPSGGCLFPMWGNERPTHEFCDATRKPGKPYCERHCSIAYENPKAKEAA